MGTSDEFDVLIVGGGPAGLLTASYLSAHYRVGLIDKGILGETSKFWVTTERRLAKHGLEHCVLYKTSRMIAGTFLGGQASAVGDFAVVDDQRVLKELLARCRENGAELTENCRLLNVQWTSDRLIAETTQGRFRARLLADASGGSSPIATTFRLHRIDGFYSNYGSLLRGIVPQTPDIVLGYVNELGDPPPILEVIPTGPDSAYCVLFIYSKALVTPQSLRESFERHCRHNPFFSMTAQSTRGVEKSGAIPIGRARLRMLPGIIALGEAALIQPPLMGTAFNEVLEHTNETCAQILTALGRPGISSVTPRRYPLVKHAQDRFQLPIVRMLMNGNVEQLDRILGTMGGFPDDLNFKFFSNELTPWQLGYLAAKLTIRLTFLPRARAY